MSAYPLTNFLVRHAAAAFVTGVSPAQDLVEHTTAILTLGLVPGPVALVGVALLECVIGLCLISGAACAAPSTCSASS